MLRELVMSHHHPQKTLTMYNVLTAKENSIKLQQKGIYQNAKILKRNLHGYKRKDDKQNNVHVKVLIKALVALLWFFTDQVLQHKV